MLASLARTHRVEHDVEITPRENLADVRLPVVDDLVRPEALAHLLVGAGARDVARAQRLRDLERKGANAPGAAKDADPEPGLHPAVVPERLERGLSREGHGSRFRERQVGGLLARLVGRDPDRRGKRRVQDGIRVNLVADLEGSDFSTHRSDDPGHVGTPAGLPRAGLVGEGPLQDLVVDRIDRDSL
jgi:hypothetical protein